MFRKSFVSLVFSSKRLQVLELDAGREKVVKYGFSELPAGLIVNYQVKDVAALSEIIRKTWKTLGIKERSVGLVIPEFSTYTKSLNLPKLGVDELDEAVRWQSQEFLPTGGRDMIMDWQIIDESEDKYNLLAVAIKQNILSGYVDATSKANLFPLVVETPSLSLTRISDGENINKLLIYVSFDETIIVLTRGKSIVASSVASSNSQNEILQTALRIIKHYSLVEVKKVMVGGVNLSKDYIGSLQASLNIPVEMIAPKIVGLDEKQIQEYLIAISLELKDPAPPEDERTVNLLPPGWVKHYEGQARNFQLWSLSLISSIFTWASFLAILIAYMFFSREAQGIKTPEEGQSSSSDSIYSQVQTINKMSAKVLAITQSRPSPEEIINTIASSKPGGIIMTRYMVNLETGRVDISGIASDRASLINFKQALDSQDKFSSVDLPINSLINETNLDFSMQLTLKTQEVKAVPKLNLQ